MRFFFSLSHLLIQDFVLSILDGAQVLDLSVNQSLSSLLLLLELLFLFILSQFLQSFLFSCILFDQFFIFQFLFSFLQLELFQLNISLMEVMFLFLLLQLSLMLSLSFPFELFLDLSPDEFTLQHLLLDLLDAVGLVLVELVLDDFGVGHFLLVFDHELLSELGVVLFGFLLFELLPLSLDFFFLLVFSLLEMILHLSFLHNIAQEHLRMESLYLILRVMHVFIRSLQRLQSLLHLQLILSRINLPPLQLLFF